MLLKSLLIAELLHTSSILGSQLFTTTITAWQGITSGASAGKQLALANADTRMKAEPHWDLLCLP